MDVHSHDGQQNEQGVPNRVSSTTMSVDKQEFQDTGIIDQELLNHEMVAQGYIIDPFEICETSFDDDMTASITAGEGDTNEAYAGVILRKPKDKVPIPSTAKTQPPDHGARRLSKDIENELKRIPSIAVKKQQLESQIMVGSSKSSLQTVTPGQIVISEALQQRALPLGTQMSLLQKKEESSMTTEKGQEHTITIEGDVSEKVKDTKKEKEAREAMEKIGKKKSRFSFRKKDKKEKSSFKKQRAQTLPEYEIIPPDTKPVASLEVHNKTNSNTANINLATTGSVDLHDHPFFSHSLPRPISSQSLKTQGQEMQNSNTLDRASPKPPSSNPPSLPGSHYSSLERTSQLRTSQRQVLCGPSSRPGSGQSTMERKTPPLPTSQPPPVPPDAKKGQSLPKMSENEDQANLADLIPGVQHDPSTPSSQTVPPPPSPSSRERAQTTPTSSHVSKEVDDEEESFPHLLGWTMQMQIPGVSITGTRGGQGATRNPTGGAAAPMNTKRQEKNKNKRKSYIY